MGIVIGMKRRGLMIVRAGDRSLHPHWLRGSGDRNWDLHISYFGKETNPYSDRPSDVSLSFETGPKFPGISSCLEELKGRINDYEYIGFPDDDIYASKEVWNNFLNITILHKPLVSQPAIHPNSFIGHWWLVQRPQFALRWVNFVEVMTPFFSREALYRAAPDFNANKSGWGLDWYWPHLFNADSRTMCIVDAAPVLHTREFGAGPLYKVLKSAGGPSPEDDLRDFLNSKGVQRLPVRVYSALRPDGSVVENPVGADAPLWIPRIRTAIRRALSIKSIKVD